MTREFRPDTDRLLLIGTLMALFAGMAWLWADVTVPVAWERGLAHGLCVLFFAIAASLLWRGADRRVSLRIGPNGLYYRDFSGETVPWSEITRVAVVVHKFDGSTIWRNPNWVRNPRGDQINFAVALPENYPKGIFRNMGRFHSKFYGAPPIAIQLYWLAGAKSADVTAEIRRHWSGKIEEIEIPIYR